MSTRFLTTLFTIVVTVAAAAPETVSAQAASAQAPRVSDDLIGRIRSGDSSATTVIVTGTAERIDSVARRHGLRVKKRLQSGAVFEVPAGRLAGVTRDGEVDLVTGNHRIESQMAVTNQAIGADIAWAGSFDEGGEGVDGGGIGVVVIDSGIANVPQLRSRVVASVDFTDPKGKALDEWGHGTHVAGIIAATPSNRRDDTRGVAPGAHILNLKVLGADGSGYVADVIEAIEWTVSHRRQYGVRVINLSLGAPPQGSWRDDPLCDAVERATRAGIVVVAAAGNRGRTDAVNPEGDPVFGSINSPGHCPHALTVGAVNTKGTPFRSDDVMASYSSKGPTRDGLIKPDFVAPGNRIRGLLAPGSGLATAHPELVSGKGVDARLELSGTSMAAAAGSGAVALLIDANGRYRPETIRLALQYSAEPLEGEGLLTSGAGSLNVLAALSMPDLDAPTSIEGEEIAASHRAFGIKDTLASADAANILWGDYSDNILWGDYSDNILWGDYSDNILWGDYSDNILWGDYSDNILWGDASDNILWGD